MLKFLAAAAALAAASAASAQTTTEIRSGSGQRALGVTFFDPVGQIFTATDTNLLSFGFELQTLNPGSANDALTLTLRQGGGFDGAVLATRQLVAAGVPATRTPTFVDFDFTGTILTLGQQYTALLSTDSSRYGVTFGPDINIFTGQALGGDAYLGGRFLATGQNDRVCGTGICDANFRFTALTPTGAVPEPATWAMLIGGLGMVGATLRRRRTPALRFA